MKFESKEIRYRGGMVDFAIPSDWREEYESSGGGTFYEDAAGSGTLRLNVLEFQRGAGVDPFGSGGFNAFREDLYLRSESKRFSEDGIECILLSWQVGYETEGGGYRIACFNYTVEAALFRGERTQRELEIIKWILKTSKFGRALGATGDFQH